MITKKDILITAKKGSAGRGVICAAYGAMHEVQVDAWDPQAASAAADHCREKVLRTIYGDVRQQAQKVLREMIHRLPPQDYQRLSELIYPLLYAGEETSAIQPQPEPTSLPCPTTPALPSH